MYLCNNNNSLHKPKRDLHHSEINQICRMISITITLLFKILPPQTILHNLNMPRNPKTVKMRVMITILTRIIISKIIFITQVLQLHPKQLQTKVFMHLHLLGQVQATSLHRDNKISLHINNRIK